MKLPLILTDTQRGYVVKDSNDEVFMSSEDFDYDIAPMEYAATIVVNSVNNFPEAVRLLKLMMSIPFMYHIPPELPVAMSEINQFLTKLEEDEKDSK